MIAAVSNVPQTRPQAILRVRCVSGGIDVLFERQKLIVQWFGRHAHGQQFAAERTRGADLGRTPHRLQICRRDNAHDGIGPM